MKRFLVVALHNNGTCRFEDGFIMDHKNGFVSIGVFENGSLKFIEMFNKDYVVSIRDVYV